MCCCKKKCDQIRNDYVKKDGVVKCVTRRSYVVSSRKESCGTVTRDLCDSGTV